MVLYRWLSVCALAHREPKNLRNLVPGANCNVYFCWHIWKYWICSKPQLQIHSCSNHFHQACPFWNIHKRVHVCSHSTACLCMCRVFQLQPHFHHHCLLHLHTGVQRRRGPRNSGRYPRGCWRAERWSSPATLVTLSCFEGFQLQVQFPCVSSECVVLAPFQKLLQTHIGHTWEPWQHNFHHWKSEMESFAASLP